MTRTIKVAVIVGSLRKESLSRKAAQALAKLAPPLLQFDFVEIGDLPHYNEDVEKAGPPESWRRFREQVAGSDAVLFVTPEYNRSVPGVLKNAIDVGSRPYGKAAWSGKPAAVMSLSMGALGGFGANHHLRQSLVFLNMPVMQQPEAYVGNAAALFADDGQMKEGGSRDFFATFIGAFADWAARFPAAA